MKKGYIKIMSCNDSAKWYNDLVGSVVQYDGVVPGLRGTETETIEYRCRQLDGYVNFVSGEDAIDVTPSQSTEDDNVRHLSVDRFDLEKQIMECWNVTNDIELITKHFIDSPHYADMSAELSDAIMNKYFAIQELYEVKFETLWDTFESLLAQNKLH